MTLALTANIVLSAIVFSAIIGLITWAIHTSRQPRSVAHIKVRSVRERLRSDTPGARAMIGYQV